MSTSNPWLDGMHNHGVRLNLIAKQISQLSHAFARTGNTAVGDELFELAQAVRQEAKVSSDLTGDKVHGDYRDAMQGTANMLKACLAGAEMGKSEPHTKG